MAAKLLKLPRPRLAELRQLAIEFHQLAPSATVELVTAIDQVDEPEDWPFLMVSPKANRDVIMFLQEASDRPGVAVRVWAELFLSINRATNEIMATITELAERTGTSERNVSRTMAHLVRFGAVDRQKSGRSVKFFLNPKVGNKLPEAKRRAAQAKAPELKLVEA